jgi:hypothetical protein
MNQTGVCGTGSRRQARRNAESAMRSGVTAPALWSGVATPAL